MDHPCVPEFSQYFNESCSRLDKGEDPRSMELPAVLERLQADIAKDLEG